MQTHLSNWDSQKREKEAIFRLFAITEMPIQLEHLFNIDRRFYIVGMNLPYHYFLKSKHVRGDIDICLIPTNSYPNYERISKFEPDLSRIIALEVKTMAYSLGKRIISPKVEFSSEKENDNLQKKARAQTEKLIKAGFDEVNLLYILSTEPEEPETGDIRDWHFAIDNADEACVLLKEHIHYEDNDKFSTLGLFIGAVESKTEQYANSSKLNTFFEPGNFIHIDTRNEFRTAFENKISSLFPLKDDKGINIKVPSVRFPLQIRACSNDNCKNIYVAFQGEKMLCPECNSEPL